MVPASAPGLPVCCFRVVSQMWAEGSMAVAVGMVHTRKHQPARCHSESHCPSRKCICSSERLQTCYPYTRRKKRLEIQGDVGGGMTWREGLGCPGDSGHGDKSPRGGVTASRTVWHLSPSSSVRWCLGALLREGTSQPTSLGLCPMPAEDVGSSLLVSTSTAQRVSHGLCLSPGFG